MIFLPAEAETEARLQKNLQFPQRDFITPVPISCNSQNEDEKGGESRHQAYPMSIHHSYRVLPNPLCISLSNAPLRLNKRGPCNKHQRCIDALLLQKFSDTFLVDF